MRKQLICLALILLAVVSEGLGEWRKITNLSDPEIVKIAKFAIAEHTKLSKLGLEYKKIIEGKRATVAGSLYDLTFAARNRDYGTIKNYEAVVWIKPWEKFKKLLSFKTV